MQAVMVVKGTISGQYHPFGVFHWCHCVSSHLQGVKNCPVLKDALRKADQSNMETGYTV